MSAATHLVKKDKPAAKTADEAAIAALEASNKAAKAKAEKKSNLELFKEELKRILTIKWHQSFPNMLQNLKS